MFDVRHFVKKSLKAHKSLNACLYFNEEYVSDIVFTKISTDILDVYEQVYTNIHPFSTHGQFSSGLEPIPAATCERWGTLRTDCQSLTG